MCDKSVEKNTAIDQKIPDSRIAEEKPVENGYSEFQDKIGPILYDMKKMTETNSRSARNVENLTIAIAALTIVSIILGAASLTIASADEIFSIFSGGIIVLCWTFGILTASLGVLVASIILDRDNYIPRKSVLSHIKQYKKYGHLQRKMGTILSSSLYFLGFALWFISILIRDYSESSFSFILYLLLIIGVSSIIFIILWVIYFFQTKSIWSHYYVLLLIPLIIGIILLMLHNCGVDINTSYMEFGTLFYGFFLIILGLIVEVAIIIVPFRYLLSVKDWYEYKSDETHVGIIVAINSRNPLSFSEIGVEKLVKHFLRSEGKPYRVYFCATKEDVITQFNNSLIHDFWIFGSGDESKLELYDGKFAYASWLKIENITTKTIHRVLKQKYVNKYISDWESKHMDE